MRDQQQKFGGLTYQESEIVLNYIRALKSETPEDAVAIEASHPDLSAFFKGARIEHSV